jgi:hypothetical protein
MTMTFSGVNNKGNIMGEIEASLRESIETSRAAYLVARRELDIAITPSAIPLSDRAVEIANYSSAYTVAWNTYKQALAEHTDFHLRGIVPRRFSPE